MPRHKDNWTTIDRGPICTRCNQPKLDHGYYSGAYQCMTRLSGVFTEKPDDTIHPPLTIKRRKGKDSMAKANVIKMPKAAKKKTASKAKSAAKSTKKTGSKFIGKTSG